MLTTPAKAAVRPVLKSHRNLAQPDFDDVALVLQGGAALGSYQAGVFEALCESGLRLTWLAGVSIGAINAAIIAGNAPQNRLAKLRDFWTRITVEPAPLAALTAMGPAFTESETGRAWLNHMSVTSALTLGVPEFYRPRIPPAWTLPSGDERATSFYDASEMRRTVESLVDFDRINRDSVRFSVGAVNVRSGNLVFFDNRTHVIGPEHIMASAALPPMFPAVEIDGEHYWDGGLVSNTPLAWVVDSKPHHDALIFQVDLWNTRGEPPRDLAEVITREMEIQYASRTRATTDAFRRLQQLKNAAQDLLQALPEDMRKLPEAQLLDSQTERMALRIVHLIYHAKRRQGTTKEFEFSRLNMLEHWSTGYNDAVRTLRHPEALARPEEDAFEGVGVFDVAVHGHL
jgi:NTE family protein